MRNQTHAATAIWCEERQKEFQRLRDQYAEGSRSYQYNDGRATVFRDLAESAKAGEPDLVIPSQGVAK